MVGFAGNIRLNIELRRDPGGARGRRGRRRAGADRPRSARHPRSLADRDRGQGRAGPPTAGQRSGGCRQPRSATWSGWPGRHSRTSGPPRPAIERSRWPAELARCGRGAAGGRDPRRTCRRRSTTWTRPRARCSATSCARPSPTSSGIPGHGPAASSCGSRSIEIVDDGDGVDRNPTAGNRRRPAEPGRPDGCARAARCEAGPRSGRWVRDPRRPAGSRPGSHRHRLGHRMTDVTRTRRTGSVDPHPAGRRPGPDPRRVRCPDRPGAGHGGGRPGRRPVTRSSPAALRSPGRTWRCWTCRCRAWTD